MTIFDPRPLYRVASRAENLSAAMDLPLSPGMEFMTAAGAGLMDSFGAGSVVKDFLTPRGVGPSAQPGTSLPERALAANPVGNALVTGYEAVRGIFGAKDSGKAITEDTYKASPYYRSSVPWDPGMTEDRAAALALQTDVRAIRSSMGDRYAFNVGPWRLPGAVTFAGSLAGGALDPINYVPVFGPASRAFLASKIGSIAAHGLIGASEGAINTAAFGAITAGDRARGGEDVSMEATLDNVVFAGIAGGLFGVGTAALGRAVGGIKRGGAYLADAKARMSIETVKNASDLRAVLDDAVGGLVNDGEVKLSPAAKPILERIATEAYDRRTQSRALELETAGVRGDKPGEVAINAAGARVAVRPEVVDLATLTHATGALQVRDRSTMASASWVEETASKLDPVRLMPAVAADQGAPIVGPDNVIDSGNGRVMAIRRAYEAYPEKAAAYKAAIEAAGYDTAGMEQPVLISRRTTDLSPEARAQFNSDSQGATMRLSALELATMDRGALDDHALAALQDAPVTAASNREFVARFLGNLPPAERNPLVDGQGMGLTADGARRIENALVAAAYGDVDAGVLRRFAQATDDNTRSVVGALSDVAGAWTRMRRRIKAGELPPEVDQTAELTEALRALSDWREQAARERRPVGVVIREGMGQLDILAGEMSAPTKLFVRSFYNSDGFEQAAGRDAIAGRLNDMLEATARHGEADLFGDVYVATKLGVLKHAYGDIETDLLQIADLEQSAREVSQAGRESAAGGDQRGNQTQPRGGGGDGSAAGQGSPGVTAPVNPPELKTAWDNWLERSPARTLDEYFDVAPAHQAELGAAARDIAEAVGDGVEWKDPGVKSKAGAAEKMQRKRYDTTKRLTDIVRGGFVVRTPDQAERIVAALGQRFEVLDEGWNVTAAGYFDRKLAVRFADGTIGEVQMWHPDMIAAKDRVGHKLYEEMRALPEGDPRVDELLQKQRELYVAAVERVSDEWLPVVSRLVAELEGKPASGNVASKASRVSGRPESMTSATLTGSQVPASETMAKASDPSMTAGRPSQSKNESFMDPGLRQWFGSSKVVDGNGAPLVVFHGTDAVFDKFASETTHLTDSRPVAATYGGRVVEAIVKFENPLVLDAKGKAFDEFAPASFFDKAKRDGHDGLIIKNLVDDADGTVPQPATSYIALDPSTVRIVGPRPAAADGKPYNPSLSPRTIDMQAPKDEPRPEGIDRAAARVGTGPDTVRDLTEQFGVTPDGKFAEEVELQQLRDLGMLTPDDEEAMAAADATVESASIYADVLRAAAACVLG